ncbi:ferritin family protein [Micromonospora zhanjiangensis]|uniref:Ferritin family protein n=1 Tax=Micromonospora zhanjiangensis TaxID=1522057 RepID=A0ABV8KNT4_9ACTN
MRTVRMTSTVAVAALVLTFGQPARAAAPTVQPSTRADALTAMHGEAFAHAKYLAYAQEAARAGQTAVAQLFTRAARTERYDHFAAEADLIGFGTDNVANLTDAIRGEEYEAYVMYPAFARQAVADGCRAAADLFTEISVDEAGHAREFRAARYAITHPGADQNFPVGTRVTPVPIRAGLPKCAGQTQANLDAALHGEAFANAKYTRYAENARATGQARLGRLFDNAASQEIGEHFAEEATLAGLVRSTDANLRDSINGEQYEATTMYPSFARRAARVGDASAADLFTEIAGDEAGHAYAFTLALINLG